jgi:FKBP-type peptidyl-prolyl cis-trans isomerase FkpA/FKBP-type peptidyl-prolyl cis-trans isomerase FklB
MQNYTSMFKMASIGKLLAALVFMSAFSGCGKDDPEKIAENDREKIIKYLTENDLEANEHSSGLFYSITREGTGGHPTSTSTVRLTYVGYIVGGKKDGTIIDAASSTRVDLRGTIPGWQEGIPLFNRGSKGFLIIPSGLAYGENLWGSRSIPPHSILKFDIELEDF